MALIDFDKFLASFITEMKKYSPITSYNIPRCIKKALEEQGLEYKEGEIVKSQRRVSAEVKETGYGESEDERIIETLISLVRFDGWHPMEWLPEDKNKMIDWLIKQKSK